MSLLYDVQCLLHDVVGSHKGSIGSLQSHYLPQLKVSPVDELLRRVDAAVAEESKYHSHDLYVSVYAVENIYRAGEGTVQINEAMQAKICEVKEEIQLSVEVWGVHRETIVGFTGDNGFPEMLVTFVLFGGARVTLSIDLSETPMIVHGEGEHARVRVDGESLWRNIAMLLLDKG